MPKRKPRNSIGIILSSISSQFRDNFLDELTKSFLERGFKTTISLTNGSLETERMYYETLAPSSDCIIVMSCAEKYSDIEDSVPTNIPVIFLFNQPEGCPMTCILENDYSAIYQGIISLANRGAKRIAFVCTSFEQSFTQNCYKAYKDALNVVSPDKAATNLIFNVEDTWSFNPRKLINSITTNECDAIFCATATLTGGIIDAMLFNTKDNSSDPLPILGYSLVDSRLSSQMYVDAIKSPYDEIVSLTIQQTFYLINHPNAPKRVSRLKGTLRMHRYDIV